MTDIYPPSVATPGRHRLVWAAAAIGVMGLVLGLVVHSLAALTERPGTPVTFAEIPFATITAAGPPISASLPRAPITDGLTLSRMIGSAAATSLRPGGTGHADGTGSACPSTFIVLLLLICIVVTMPVARRRSRAMTLSGRWLVRVERADDPASIRRRLCVSRT